MNDGLFILQILYLIAPVVLAGVAHVIVLKLNILPQLKIPLDAGKHIGSARLFGDNKTWRGIIIMAVGSAVVMALQSYLYKTSTLAQEFSFFDYSAINPWISGAIFGLGYSLGELPNSFAKRQLGIAPGQRSKGTPNSKIWYFIDQSDSVIGSLITMRYFFPASFAISLACFAIGLLLHIGIDQMLYLIKVKS